MTTPLEVCIEPARRHRSLASEVELTKVNVKYLPRHLADIVECLYPGAHSGYGHPGHAGAGRAPLLLLVPLLPPDHRRGGGHQQNQGGQS